MDRRAEDERISKIETDVATIKAKIENGLTERSIKNTEHLEALHDRHLDIRKDFDVFRVEFKAYQSQAIDDFIEVKDSLKSICDTQKNWTRTALALIIAIGGVMFSLIIWIVTNAEWLLTIVNHLKSI